MIALTLALFLSTAQADDTANKAMPAPAPKVATDAPPANAANRIDVPPQAVQGGLDKNAIDSTVRKNLDKIAACYNDNNKAEAPAAGRVNTKFVIGNEGKVVSAAILSSELKNETIEGCVVKELQALVFPAPQGGGTVEVDYPFSFTPEKKAAAKKKKK